MRHKILIAEQTDTLRSIAETVLRQNGYDVIAVTAAEKAREVLGLSQPDLIIVGADLVTPDGTPYFERIRQDARTNSIPVLLFEPAGQSDAVFPDEVIISRPFDPRDFLHKVSVFLGDKKSANPTAPAEAANSVVDDKFLDAALGLDRIDVTDSEVMNNTTIGPNTQPSSGSEKLIGLDTGPIDDADFGHSTVESLIIDEDSSQIKHRKMGRTEPPAAGTGKIEILTDQFGMVSSSPSGDGGDSEGDVHDYDWFVDAMNTEGDPDGKPAHADSGSISITDPSAAVDPITPSPVTSPASNSTPSVGVEHFIDEFKKEMEQVRSEEVSEPVQTDRVKAPDAVVDEMAWEETLEKIGPTQIDIFIKEFAREVGQKVAEMMASRIDPDKLLRMIKSEIIERQEKSSR